MPAPKGHPPYNKNGEGGRPKIYNKEFIEKEADALEIWNKNKSNIFIEDFCEERGYHDSRIPEFVKENERFSDVYNMLKMKQKVSLFKAGLTGKFKYPMCAMILGNVHNIYAKTEQKLSGDCVSPLAFVVNLNDGNTKDLIQEENE